MRTVIETPTFQKQARKLWSEDQRLAFIAWIAANPLAGSVIPGADGARKVRWSHRDSGTSGGVRIIYFNRSEEGTLVLVAVYAKSHRSKMSPIEIRQVI